MPEPGPKSFRFSLGTVFFVLTATCVWLAALHVAPLASYAMLLLYGAALCFYGAAKDRPVLGFVGLLLLLFLLGIAPQMSIFQSFFGRL
jgi:hypothetical protein